MAGELLLDTNIVIPILNSDPQVTELLSRAGAVHVPSIVIGELYYGAARGTRVRENLERLASYAAGVDVLPCTRQTAERYGQIKSRLQSSGRPIPDNDIWIAAVAMQHDLILVTRDAHFGSIEDLRTTTW
jgi:tRNA(fMet)-specific endonuclease VapC